MAHQGRVIFLHLPKTAGHSVHTVLSHFFHDTEICPVRFDSELSDCKLGDLRRYRLYSGHFNWNVLDFTPEPRFVFSVLRSPEERILSLYMYLRRQAETLPIDRPGAPGVHLAKTLSPDDYFCLESLPLRNTLDNLYDNFYTYYFAGKSYIARNQLIQQKHAPNDLLQLATKNAATLSALYDLSEINQIGPDVARHLQVTVTHWPPLQHLNQGDAISLAERYEKLKSWGATQKTRDRIQYFCRLDNLFYAEFLKGHFMGSN